MTISAWIASYFSYFILFLCLFQQRPFGVQSIPQPWFFVVKHCLFLVSRRFEYTDTRENVCCNIRNVKSIICIALLHSVYHLLCVFFFLRDFDGRRTSQSLYVHVPLSLRYLSSLPLFPKTSGKPSLLFRDEISQPFCSLYF